MWKLYSEYFSVFDMVAVFANTGQENEKTLAFVDRCSKEWCIPVTWVEAVVNKGRVGCTHRIVTFENASRNGEPFEAVIQKYGIPNKAYPHCTRELKLNPIKSYLSSLGWDNYLSAVGIRSDEKRRIREDFLFHRLVYPMSGEWPMMFPTTKPFINDWWQDQPFRLGLEEHQGNCTWCWKKSLTKHSMIAQESPEVFEFPKRMEDQYGLNGHNLDGTKRVFFRGNTSTDNLIQITKQLTRRPLFDPDEDSGCSESCEAFV